MNLNQTMRSPDAVESPLQIVFGGANPPTSRAVQMVEAVAGAWQSLPAACPMQSYMWARACAEAFTNGEPRIITAGNSSVRSIAALLRPEGVRAFLPLASALYEPAEFAYADAEAAGQLAEAVARLQAPLYINDAFADSLFIEQLRRVCGRRLVARPYPGHPWLPLDESWLEPESHLNSGRRSDLRRAQRNAEKIGPVRIEINIPDAGSLESLLAEAFRVEAANWKGRQGSALAFDPAVGRFYRRFAEAACARGLLRVGLLWIGDRAVAMQLAIEQNSTFWLFKMGFDEEFSRVSPGMLLMVESFRFASQRGCTRYELSGKSEPWNQLWTRQEHAAISVHVHEPGIRGWVAVATDVARAAVRSRLRGHAAGAAK